MVDGFKYEVSVARRSPSALCVTLNDSSVEVLTRHLTDAGFLMQVDTFSQCLISRYLMQVGACVCGGGCVSCHVKVECNDSEARGSCVIRATQCVAPINRRLSTRALAWAVLALSLNSRC